MSTPDYITRAEHDKDIQRLNEADMTLQNAIIDMERALRTDYEQKLTAAISSVNHTLDATKQDLKEDIGGIEIHLTDQDEVLKDQNKFFYSAVGSGVLALLTGVVTFIVLSSVGVIHFG
jgi:hypothetical protein